MMNCIQISSSVCVCGNGDGQSVLRLHNQPNLFAGGSPGWNFEERTIVALICNRTISPSRSHPLQEELNMCRKIGRRISNVIITITIITIIIITTIIILVIFSITIAYMSLFVTVNCFQAQLQAVEKKALEVFYCIQQGFSLWPRGSQHTNGQNQIQIEIQFNTVEIQISSIK